jgi:hypothetical protein
VYSVYLEYSRDSFDELIPPAISVNFNLPKRASKWTRWDLGDHPWRQHIELAGAHLEDTCRIARSHLRVLGSSAPAEALLDRVAKKLNEGLLEPILDVTDDFVVVPVDVERGSAGVIAAILRLAPAARVQLLRERGLLD